MIGTCALGPGLRLSSWEMQRWHVLYSEVIWHIWKLYLGDQLRVETDAMAQRSYGGIYSNAVLQRIVMDRARVLSPRYRSGTFRVDTSAFSRTRGQGPKSMLYRWA